MTADYRENEMMLRTMAEDARLGEKALRDKSRLEVRGLVTALNASRQRLRDIAKQQVDLELERMQVSERIDALEDALLRNR